MGIGYWVAFRKLGIDLGIQFSNSPNPRRSRLLHCVSVAGEGSTSNFLFLVVGHIKFPTPRRICIPDPDPQQIAEDGFPIIAIAHQQHTLAGFGKKDGVMLEAFTVALLEGTVAVRRLQDTPAHTLAERDIIKSRSVFVGQRTELCFTSNTYRRFKQSINNR